MYMFPSWLDNDANVGWAVHHYWSVVNHVNIILTPWNTCKERLTWVGFHNHALNLSVSPTNGWFKFNDSLCCSYKYNWCKCTCTGKIYILLIIFLNFAWNMYTFTSTIWIKLMCYIIVPSGHCKTKHWSVPIY